MTRINVGIPPSELTTKHLIAEHKEIVRVPNCVAKGRFSLKGQPEIFKLGQGHVKFFYTRLGYLKKRYEEIYQNCIERGYKVTYYGNSWDKVPKEFMNDYTPTQNDIDIIKQRIHERLNKNETDKIK
jgi:deoxyribonuclease (pyrimidine dimer)